MMKKPLYLRIGDIVFTVLLALEAVCYSAVFGFLSGSWDFVHLLNHNAETKIDFLGNTLDFLKNGGLVIVRNILLIMLAVCVLLRVLAAVLKTDVRLTSYVTVFIKGGACILLVPFLLLHILNDRTFAIEMVFLFVWVQLFAGAVTYAAVTLFHILRKMILQKNNA